MSNIEFFNFIYGVINIFNIDFFNILMNRREIYLLDSSVSFICQFLTFFVVFYFIFSPKKAGRGNLLTRISIKFPLFYETISGFLLVSSLVLFYF